MWALFIWFRVGTGGLSWTLQWIFEFRKAAFTQKQQAIHAAFELACITVRNVHTGAVAISLLKLLWYERVGDMIWCIACCLLLVASLWILPKRRQIFLLTERLSASKERLCYMNIVRSLQSVWFRIWRMMYYTRLDNDDTAQSSCVLTRSSTA
jgi:hypothetical protein